MLSTGGWIFRCFTFFSEKYFDQTQGYVGVYRADIKAVDHAKLVPDRSPGVPIDFEQIDFSGSIFIYFSFKSSYFNPGSLRKSSGDVRDHFLNIWL